MKTNQRPTVALFLISIGFFLASLRPVLAIARELDDQVCDVSADYALGVEDYAEAIRLHREVIRSNPDDALAHYHLGFAEGMLGNISEEMREYAQARKLGLRLWDLFLNLGLVQLEVNDVHGATDSLRTAVLLGGEHPETHFTLALAEERRGAFANAERETRRSLALSPNDVDARNLIGVIYAAEGRTANAALVWRLIIKDLPDYEPARKNLILLDSTNQVVPVDTLELPRSPTITHQQTPD